MKRLTVMVSACLVAAVAFAAQCQGTTQKGERCKRDAAEGSKYCIGHGEQEKAKAAEKKAAEKKAADKAAPAKLKDDGTCWAVTEAGTRCKHKKDGETDYCKQHAATVKAKKQGKCRALKWDGERCTRDADDGFLYCAQHRKQPATGKKPSAKK